MRLTPVGLALVTVAVAEQEGLETEAAATHVIDGIGASATKVTDGLIGRFGDVDGSQFASADQAGHTELLEPSGNAEAARPGLVGNLQLCLGVSQADPDQGLFEPAQVIGDSAKEADLALGTGLSDSDSDGVFVDIETKIECNSLHGVVVRLHSHDESERI